MSKPFKDSGFGKFIWNLGDTFKGKTKTGKALDSVLEILPVPNPIRYAREADQQKKLQKLMTEHAVQKAAQESGFSFDDMIEDSPTWVRPALACLALVGLMVLVGLEIIEPAFLIQALQAIFAN